MTDFGELVPFDGIVYRAVLARPDRTVTQLTQQLDEPDAALDTANTANTADHVDNVAKAVDRLNAMGLLRTSDNDRLTAVSPMLAEATVLGAEDLELGARRAAVEQRRDSLRQLIPAWNDALAEVVNESTVEVIDGQTAIVNTMMHYAATCREELMSVAPGRMAASRIDGRTRVANMYSLSRGIQTRLIYQHVAMRDRAMRAYLNEQAQHGARIRLTPSVPGRGLVVDREVALLPIPTGEPGGQELAIVRERAIVTWIVATFEQLWAEAAPFEDVVTRDDDDTEIDETRAAILRLMAEGEKDEAISRRLSISVRTCRRHIADYMTQVGASSRFQAGVIAARAGHTDAPSAG